MSIIRKCVKAGSWYSFKCSKNIKTWLSGAKVTVPSDAKCRAVIGPHAGLSYCGETSAYGYRNCMDSTRDIETVFVIGPTHYEYIQGCALSVADVCQTPDRDLPVNKAIVGKLGQTGIFKKFSIYQEEKEHSLELHFPFVAHCFPENIKIVPIIVGELSKQECQKYAKTLLPYFLEPKNFFVISSDFCHWGRRFGYTYHDSKKFSKPWQSIEDLDKRGVSAIVSKDPEQWDRYIKKTNNSVCGKKPIWLLMEMVKQSKDDSLEFKMTHYSQSSKARSMGDSSVSYASVVLYKK